MNIEIANRLVELRKKNGLSQEELAAKLGLSRQAVSKWERAEASPDTDNLICLAKLYGVSLDRLLSTDEDIDTIVNESKKEKDTEGNSQSKDDEDTHIYCDGEDEFDFEDDAHPSCEDDIDIRDKDGSTVHVDIKGIHVEKANSKRKNCNFNETRHNEKVKKRGLVLAKSVCSGVFTLSVPVVYICMGVFSIPDNSSWEMWWVLFLLIPIFTSLFDVFISKRITKFCFPCAVTFVYLFLGMAGTTGLIPDFFGWHPYWFLFLIIPVFYAVFKPLDNFMAERRYRQAHQLGSDDAINAEGWEEIEDEDDYGE